VKTTVCSSPRIHTLACGDGVEEHVVGGVDDAVGPAADVVEGHRLQVGPGSTTLPTSVVPLTTVVLTVVKLTEPAAGRAVAVGVQEAAVGGRADLAAIHGAR
jgi:hypothetical protein